MQGPESDCTLMNVSSEQNMLEAYQRHVNRWANYKGTVPWRPRAGLGPVAGEVKGRILEAGNTTCLKQSLNPKPLNPEPPGPSTQTLQTPHRNPKSKALQDHFALRRTSLSAAAETMVVEPRWSMVTEAWVVQGTGTAV